MSPNASSRTPRDYNLVKTGKSHNSNVDSSIKLQGKINALKCISKGCLITAPNTCLCREALLRSFF